MYRLTLRSKRVWKRLWCRLFGCDMQRQYGGINERGHNIEGFVCVRCLRVEERHAR